ncbi:hypothetical protein PLESTB_000115100 [Pleodorina starrii]|uniref:MYND-type domain-containing protein n=1 Tax=Pleodorina starrii TaxID=330485 RepID=A0A9W6BB77_9CHLO|nr:hypothetical protein PLESTM_000110700 [Pleodorina starrii]GLC48595.1 hypothetical protein PLESTB_000115100 [Pleodorina starrii]GLC71916.1 hypothetical protein PLESTF_001180800 [Pleodorina starrii]
MLDFTTSPLQGRSLVDFIDMAELPYESSNMASVDYARQQAPYRRNRLDDERWARIAADNSVMARKLADIRREPPANFHAPKGYQSVAGGQRRRQERAGKAQSDMPETLHYVPPAPWPPTEPAHQIVRQSKAQRELDVANGHVATKLREAYRHHGGSLLEKHKLGVGFDCNERWAQRTALYDTAGGAATTAAAVAVAGGARVLDLEQASVPKSLGVAHCGGCGSRCFYAADGLRLMRCRACKAAWYCSEACAKMDYQSHKALCKYATTGHWTPGGARPAEDCWVSNAAMAELRNQLRRRAAAAALAQRTTGTTNPPTLRNSAASASPMQWHGAEANEQAGASPRPPSAAGGAAGAEGSSPARRRSAAGLRESGAEALEGEVEVLFSLEARYRQLREREIAAERELADVEYRANNGLDGPRPCMYVMKRFAEPAAAAGGASGRGGGGTGGGGGRRPASAGPRLRGGGEGVKGEEKKPARKKPAWQDTARYL